FVQFAGTENDPRRAVEVKGDHQNESPAGQREGSETCRARPRYKKSMRFPSCGCSQLSFVVGMGPRLRRSILVAVVAALRNVSSLLIIVPTNVGPMRLSISA